MSLSTSTSRMSLLSGAAITAALMTTCLTASALPAFTFDPIVTGAGGTTIYADNILISEFATVTFVDASGGFSQAGYLPVTGFQLGGSALTPTGLNSTYGLYIKFTATGSLTTDAGSGISSGPFTSLSYTLYGYNGTATFGFDASHNATETAINEVALATGTLISGKATSVPDDEGGFTPGASVKVAVSPAFFSSPGFYYSVGRAAFNNTPSTVETFAGGFIVRQGGGALNFQTPVAVPVPEPSSTALLLAGLGIVGLLYRRKMGARQA